MIEAVRPTLRLLWPVRDLTVRGRLSAVGHAIITQDMRDAQAILLEHAASTTRLRGAVSGPVAPCLNRSLVAEKGKRQEVAGFHETFEPLDRDKSVDPGKFVFQAGSKIQVGVALSRRGCNLENDCDLGRTNALCGAEASLRNIRSSRRINCSRLANA